MQIDHYPSGWNEFDTFVVHVGAPFFGFKSDAGDVNRFCARFRVAAAFRRLELDGYSAATQEGYSSLCRLLLVWSAFESFLSIFGLDQKSVGPILDRHGALPVIAAVKAADPGGAFYGFIYARVNATHKAQLGNYKNDDPCNAGYLASSIRHIFSHGHLTPNAAQVDPNNVATICNALSDFLLMAMDQEFSDCIDKGMNEIFGV